MFAAIRKIKGHNTQESRALKVANWGAPLCDVFASGPGCLLSINTPVEQQLAWLHTAILQFSRSEEHTSELQSLMRISYAVFCLKKKNAHVAYQDNTTQLI